MKGISRVRPQGYDDPLLVAVMRRHGLDELPLFKHRPKEILDRMRRWKELASDRDGPVAESAGPLPIPPPWPPRSRRWRTISVPMRLASPGSRPS